jgi:hypothetical protein
MDYVFTCLYHFRASIVRQAVSVKSENLDLKSTLID